MRLGGATLVAALVAGTAWAGVGWSAPAGAAVTVTSSGTAVTVAVSGGTAVAVTCSGGQIRAQGVAPTPPVTCAAATTLTVVGDASNDVIDVAGVGSAFANLASVVVRPGGGSNVVVGSPKRDTVTGSAGGVDQVTLDAAGVADGGVNLGGDAGDALTVVGTAGADVVTVASGSPLSRTDVTRGTWTVPVTGARSLGIAAGDGADVVDATGLRDGAVTTFTATGGSGDDVLRGGDPVSLLGGGAGANTLVGGPRADALFSDSTADTVEGRGGADQIVDQGSGPVGGRTIVGPAPGNDGWTVRADGYAALRTRSLSAESTRITAAMARTGIQQVGTGVGSLTFQVDGAGSPADRVVLALAALPSQQQTVTSTSAQTIVDLVVPTGSWRRSGARVTFTGPYRDVIVGTGTTVAIRAPFTDPEERFAHRALRDVEMRLPTPAERAELRSDLESGDATREDLAARLTSTDVYRGLAVDRAFIDILRRPTDAAGQAYWVGRLRGGLVTRKVRANLYGSAEYATVQGGGTTLGYVTAAYRDILGREPEPSGLGYWVDLIRSGTPRGTVAERFLATSEARGVIVHDEFVRWVDRAPSPAELSQWRTRLAETAVDQEVELVRFLLASRAYFTVEEG